jgi:hypothetical protein
MVALAHPGDIRGGISVCFQRGVDATENNLGAGPPLEKGRDKIRLGRIVHGDNDLGGFGLNARQDLASGRALHIGIRPRLASR